jgi:hypothetical protein
MGLVEQYRLEPDWLAGEARYRRYCYCWGGGGVGRTGAGWGGGYGGVWLEGGGEWAKRLASW